MSTMIAAPFEERSGRCFLAQPILALGLVLLLALATPARANGPAFACDALLAPVGNPGFVQLDACILVARLVCEGNACSIQVEQTYRLHNRDRVKGETLQLALPTDLCGPAGQNNIALRDGQGATLDPATTDPQQGPIWRIDLAPNASQNLVLSRTYALQAEHFVPWRWDLAPLARWGSVAGLRIEFHTPEFIQDEVLLQVEPGNVALEGKKLVWEYENLQNPAIHELIMLSPATWQRMSTLRAGGAHAELARLYEALQDAARQEAIPFPDHYGEIVAELEAAIADDSGNLAARLELARLYRSRADMLPTLKLNYLLLAAQELAKALDVQPGNAEVARALSETYYAAASAANEGGDPAGALTYLKKAEVPGAPLPQDQAQRQDLTLRWALDMAKQGQVAEAIVQLEDVLSPAAQDALLRYAPPFVSLRTEIELKPGTRTAHYDIRLYPPSARKAHGALQELAGRLKMLEGSEVKLAQEDDQATLDIVLSYRSLDELRQRTAALNKLFTLSPDLLATCVALPWQSDLQTYAVDHLPWRDRYLYREYVDLSAAQKAWETEAQYIGWRLIELRSTTPADERGQIEQQLTLIALTEQRQIWEYLPSASYWVYHAPAQAPEAQPMSWLLDWGETRNLEAASNVYYMGFIARGFLLLAAVIIIPSVLLRLFRR